MLLKYVPNENHVIALVRLATCLVVCGVLGFATACSGGSGAKTVYHHRMTTVGQELSDLKRAHDQGALSDDEYESQKEKLLEDQED